MIQLQGIDGKLKSLVTLPVDHYPSGEIMIKTAEFPRTIVVRTTLVSELMEALFYVDALAWRHHNVDNLVLPYVPGARQDRLNNKGDFLFTLKSVAREINARNFTEVFVLDPHSEVTTALIENCHPMALIDESTAEELRKVGYDAVIIPDAGASKRATAVADLLGVPTLQAWKYRDVGTGKLSGFGIEPLPAVGKTTTEGKFLIVDDICDGGGTFIGLASLADLRWRWVDLYVSHGLFTQGIKPLEEAFHHIYTTDSIPTTTNLLAEKLTVFNRFI